MSNSNSGTTDTKYVEDNDGIKLLREKFGCPLGSNDFCVYAFAVKKGWVAVDNENGTWSLCRWTPGSSVVSLYFTGTANQIVDVVSILDDKISLPKNGRDSGWDGWSSSQLKAELRDRLIHFYGKTDGSLSIPNTREGDIIRLTAEMLNAEEREIRENGSV